MSSEIAKCHPRCKIPPFITTGLIQSCNMGTSKDKLNINYINMGIVTLYTNMFSMNSSIRCLQKQQHCHLIQMQCKTLLKTIVFKEIELV